jgi:predicted 3-demethylubiquinone-9 3-methyltransferase (glyoxalase superfamily)
MAKIKSDQQIRPCLWFNGNAEEAVKFYGSVFKKFKKGTVTLYPKNGPYPEGTVCTIQFQIAGMEFLALNAGPEFKFNEAISLMIYCKNQKEIDHYWEELSRGGSKIECGWLKDKFGLAWQIVPAILDEMFAAKDAGKTAKVLQAVWKMKKIDIQTLKEAYKS